MKYKNILNLSNIFFKLSSEDINQEDIEKEVKDFKSINLKDIKYFIEHYIKPIRDNLLEYFRSENKEILDYINEDMQEFHKLIVKFSPESLSENLDPEFFLFITDEDIWLHLNKITEPDEDFINNISDQVEEIIQKWQDKILN